MDEFRSSYQSTQPVQVGDRISLTCESLAEAGDGICRVQNYIVFVPGVLAGETAKVEITSAGRKHARGEVLEIEEASSERVEPRCAHFGDCGGCQWQHMSYAAQLEAKTETVRNELAYVLDRDPEDLPVQPALGVTDPWGQRNRIALQVQEQYGMLQGGLYRRRSREVVHVQDCPVSHPESLRVAQLGLELAREEGLEAWNPRNDAGTLRTLVCRANSRSETQLSLVVRQRSRREIQAFCDGAARLPITGLILNHNTGPQDKLFGRQTEILQGSEYQTEQVAGVTLRLSPGAWFRTANAAVENIAATVCAMVGTPKGRVYDLYSGCGLLALALARAGCADVVGIEDFPRALADAQAGARLSELGAVRFEKDRVEDFVRDFRGDAPKAVVLDPPAQGCGPFVLQNLARRVQPGRIVYVASTLSTLAIETRTLTKLGYTLSQVQPIDVAPHTTQVEAVALFEPKLGGMYGKRQSSVAQARRLLDRIRKEES